MGELERIQDAYRKRAREGTSDPYRYTNPAFLFHMQERERTLLETVRRCGIDLEGTRVLEVGCGTGHILDRFLEFGAGASFGVELMPDRVRAARENYSRVRVARGDGGNLPFPDGAFDLVTQFMCVSSVLDPDLRKRIAAEMWRVTRPGGAVLSYDMRGTPAPLRMARGLRRGLYGLAGRLKGKSIPASERRATPIRPISAEELSTLFPQGRMTRVAATLDFPLAAVAARSHTRAVLLSRLPFLRSHFLAVVQKPEGAKP